MKTIKIDLSQDLKSIELIPLSDLHLGDIHCEYRLITEQLKYIKEHDNAYCVLNGDLMDSAIKTSIGDVFSANLQPMEQLEQCVKLFEPIKDKILAILPGNHEMRHYKNNGIDVTELMAAQLGIQERYSATSALLFIRVGFGYLEGKETKKRPVYYTVYLNHGSRGGRTVGSKLNALSDYSSIVDADIYICGHTHMPAVFKQDFFRVSASNNTVKQVPHLFVNTNAFLGYGGYGDGQGYKPANTTVPIITLDGWRKKASVKL